MDTARAWRNSLSFQWLDRARTSIAPFSSPQRLVTAAARYDAKLYLVVDVGRKPANCRLMDLDPVTYAS